jgi:ribosomal protein L7Ae-like RNA K-turn-binding protein
LPSWQNSLGSSPMGVAMNPAKLRAAIGFAARSGQLACGDSACRKALQMGKACLVLIDDSAAENTQNRFKTLCERYQTRCQMAPADVQLAQAAGRDTAKVFAITEENLAKMAMSAFDK